MLKLKKAKWTERLHERGQNLRLAFKIFWESNPRTAKWVILITIFDGLIPLALVYATQYAVNAYNQSASFSAWLTGPALIFLGILAINQLSSFLGNWLRIYHESNLSDYLDAAIQDKAAEADMVAYESSDFHDRLYRAGFESEDHVLEIVEQLIFLISGGTTLIGLFWIVSQFEWWLPCLFIAAALPLFATLILHAHSRYQWSKTMTQTQRESRYYNWLLMGDEAAGEIRMFGLKDYFGNQYKNLRSKILRSRLKLHQRQSIRATVANLASLAMMAIGMVFILRKFQSGEISMGSAALFAHSVMLCLGSVKAMVGESANLYRSTLFLTDLGFILSMKPKIKAPLDPSSLPKSAQMEIDFEKVIFSYPDTSQPALNDISLRIPAQKITLLYGENGSGKSTMSKLICRFFDPDEGKVKLGGTDIKDFDPAELRNQVGVIFQDPVRYYFTARNNITLGNIGRPYSESTFSEAIEQAQLRDILEELPKKEHTQLGRWFQDGTQLSCGQWQRLALARLHYSNRPIMILDEPTSAMDPWTEQKWLKSLKENANGKTVLVITHRISTVQIADHVIVLKHGKVVESGSPSELQRKKGYFSELKHTTIST
jgi:ATP-binding cassette, subfamily B, bacterial